MDKPIYSVRNWETSFENAASRKIIRASWVPIPNKHDGKGFKRIARDPQGVQVFCAWNLLIEVASKMPVRGILADEDGPLDANDLADMTSFPVEIFEAAFTLLVRPDIAWLDCTANGSPLPASAAPLVASPPPLVASPSRTEQKGTEPNRREGNGSAAATLPFSGADFIKEWEDYEKHRKQMRKPLTAIGRERLFKQFEKWGEKRTVANLRYSMADGRTWQGVFEDPKGAAPSQARIFESEPSGPSDCSRCNGTGNEIVPGKGSRPCDHLTLTEEME